MFYYSFLFWLLFVVVIVVVVVVILVINPYFQEVSGSLQNKGWNGGSCGEDALLIGKEEESRGISEACQPAVGEVKKKKIEPLSCSPYLES